jgi:hypothetical protein
LKLAKRGWAASASFFWSADRSLIESAPFRIWSMKSTGPFLVTGPQRDLAIRAPFWIVAHGVLKAGPVVLLLGGEAQVGPHARGSRVELISKLVCGQFRVAWAILGNGGASQRSAGYQCGRRDMKQCFFMAVAFRCRLSKVTQKMDLDLRRMVVISGWTKS